MAAAEPQSSESPFASIRELAAAERRITAAMTVVKDELLAAIRTSNEDHEATHKVMRETGDERHRLIDQMVLARRVDDAERRGAVKAGVILLRGLRLVNEFRGVLLVLAIAAAIVSGSVQVSVAP